MEESLPITTLPRAKVTKGTKKVDFSKVWAERFYEIELGVGALPEHEITEALSGGRVIRPRMNVRVAHTNG